MNILLIAAALAAFSVTGTAAKPCFPRIQMDAYLDHYDRNGKHAWGLTRRQSSKNQMLVELFVNNDLNIWIILITSPNGISCIQLRGTRRTDYKKLGPKA